MRFYSNLLLITVLSSTVFFTYGCKKQDSILSRFDSEMRLLTEKLSETVVELMAVPDSGEIEKVIGSALLISKDGKLLTSATVLREGKPMVARINNTFNVDVTLIGSDWETNLALLKLDSLMKISTTPLIGSRDIQAGQMGFLVGSMPLLKETTITFGTLTHSQIGGDDPYDNPLFVLSSFSVLARPGAPVFDVNAQLVGIVDGKLHTSQLGMWTVIPLKTIRTILPILERGGGVPRGYLGIDPLNLQEKENGIQGIQIKKVFPNSPAEKIGFLEGDCILEVDNIRIKRLATLRIQISKNPDELVTINFLRKNQKLTKQIRLSSRVTSSTDEVRNPLRKL